MPSSSSTTNTAKQKKGTGGPKTYATLAAVVGIRQDTTTSRPDDAFLVDHKHIIKPFESQIRLFAVGRATLRDFFYYKTSSSEEADDSDNDDDDDTYIINMDHDDDAPIILMAEFDVLMDTNERSNDEGTYYFSSPVHYMNRLATLKNQLNRLHDERLKLVKGVTAAQHRLQNRHEYYEDSDGIGEITTNKRETSMIDDDLSIMLEFLKRYGQGGNHHDGEHYRRSSNNNLHYQQQRRDPSLLLSLDNYGLGTYSSSMSSLHDLMSVCIQEQLKDYYSATILQEEEFEMMVFSFVCWRSLKEWCSVEDLVWCYTTNNTQERLERAYTIMHQHRELLILLGRQLSQDLVECGEECDFLW